MGTKISGMTKPPFDVEHIPPGSRLELYISPACPYCIRAIAHYDQLGTSYTLHDAQNDLATRAKMFAFTGSDPTVPAIVIDGTYVQSGWGKPPRG
ncbi:MAG: glutaredoxin domain-containing protein [Candidatus Baltobacteraceae bacterium]